MYPSYICIYIYIRSIYIYTYLPFRLILSANPITRSPRVETKTDPVSTIENKQIERLCIGSTPSKCTKKTEPNVGEKQGKTHTHTRGHAPKTNRPECLADREETRQIQVGAKLMFSHYVRTGFCPISAGPYLVLCTAECAFLAQHFGFQSLSSMILWCHVPSSDYENAQQQQRVSPLHIIRTRTTQTTTTKRHELCLWGRKHEI